MIDVIFTDTHFGWKNNSVVWLNSQLNFIYKQFIPTIKRLKKEDSIRVIHCGDVFDSRSTISTFIASKTIKAFSDIRKECDEFIILCGNHDFYSPNSDEVNTVELFMRDMDIDIVSKDVLTRDNHAFIPWYKWIDREQLNISEQYIFCHGDILAEKLPDWTIGKTIISGHIHIPGKRHNLINLGSCYSLNFADANSERGFYILKNGNIEFIKNEESINFYRLYDNEILDFDISVLNVNDYIELYLMENNMIKQSYMDKLKKFVETFSHVWIIPQITKIENETSDFKIYDIESIIEESISDELKPFYDIVKKRLNSQ